MSSRRRDVVKVPEQDTNLLARVLYHLRIEGMTVHVVLNEADSVWEVELS